MSWVRTISDYHGQTELIYAYLSGMSLFQLPSEIEYFLTDANSILRHGKIHLSRGKASRLDRRLAIHHAHHAVELVLRKKAELLGLNPFEFPVLVKSLKKQKVVIP